MLKKWLGLIIGLLMFAFSFTGCNRGMPNDATSDLHSNNANASESTPGTAEPNNQEASGNLSPDPSHDKEQAAIEKDVCMQAMEKWNKLGGNFDFKNIEDIDTDTLVKMYSSYMMQTEALDFSVPDVWMDLTGFDRFVKDYFNLDPEPFHQNYHGASNNFDLERGFLFYPHTSICPSDTTYSLLSYKDNNDGTYCFEQLAAWELPKELLPANESNLIERITTVTFSYDQGNIIFLKATYQQDGEQL